jgi:hypothetical protein
VYALNDPFFEKTERALCVWLECEAHVELSVIGVVVRRRAASMPVKGD